jgi:hypothetical protein
MLVASLARESGIMSNATLTAADALIALLVPAYPTTGATFVESACWADDLKAQGTAQEANWHFIDIPVCRLPSPSACPPPQEDNVVWAIGSAHSTMYSKKSAPLDKARQLRFILHFVGDVHQPLHAATYFSQDFPVGDRGGNSWNVSGFNWTSELHALWDGGLGQWYGDLPRPLNATGAAWVSGFTGRLAAEWPVSSLGPEIANFNVTAWAQESNDLAVSVAYTAPQAPTPVPAGYVAAGQALCRKRVAVAAYRLASLVEYIFTSGAFAEEL